MNLTEEQLSRLPSWARFDAQEDRILVDPAEVFPKYLAQLGLEKTKFSMSIVRRILEEQILRAVVKMQVVRYTGPNEFIVLVEPKWSEEARIALADYLPDGAVGLRHYSDDFILIRLTKAEDWDIREQPEDPDTNKTEESAARMWTHYFFPQHL